MRNGELGERTKKIVNSLNKLSCISINVGHLGNNINVCSILELYPFCSKSIYRVNKYCLNTLKMKTRCWGILSPKKACNTSWDHWGNLSTWLSLFFPPCPKQKTKTSRNYLGLISRYKNGCLDPMVRQFWKSVKLRMALIALMILT